MKSNRFGPQALFLALAPLLLCALCVLLWTGGATNRASPTTTHTGAQAQQAPTPLPTGQPPVVERIYFPLAAAQPFTAFVTCGQWSLAADFRADIFPINPQGDRCGNATIWRFATSSTTLPHFDVNVEATGAQGWSPQAGAPALLLQNPASAPITLAGGLQLTPQAILMRPTTETAILAIWRSPIAARIAIAGAVADLDPNLPAASAWSLNLNGVPLASGRPANGGTQQLRAGSGGSTLADLTVARGDEIALTLPADSAPAAARAQLTLTVWPASVTLDGPSSASTDAPAPFTATVAPDFTGLPITFRWRATGLPNRTRVLAATTDAAPFVWNTPGVKTVEVAATNAAGTVTATHVVTVSAPPFSLTLQGPDTTFADSPTAYTATIRTAGAALPLTFDWTLDGQPQRTITGNTVQDTLTVAWPGPGSYLLKVVATNQLGAVEQGVGVYVEARRLLPLVRQE